MTDPEPIYDEGEPDDTNQIALMPHGLQITVQKISTKAKHIKVKVIPGWRAKLAEKGKRPLGYGLRRCDMKLTLVRR